MRTLSEERRLYTWREKQNIRNTGLIGILIGLTVDKYTSCAVHILFWWKYSTLMGFNEKKRGVKVIRSWGTIHIFGYVKYLQQSLTRWRVVMDNPRQCRKVWQPFPPRGYGDEEGWKNPESSYSNRPETSGVWKSSFLPEGEDENLIKVMTCENHRETGRRRTGEECLGKSTAMSELREMRLSGKQDVILIILMNNQQVWTAATVFF